MNIKKQHCFKPESPLGCEKLKDENYSSGKLLEIPIVIISAHLND